MAAVAARGPVGKGRDISLAALQRHDPYINRIVDVASQVALYTFGHRANEWVRADARGAGRRVGTGLPAGREPPWGGDATPRRMEVPSGGSRAPGRSRGDCSPGPGVWGREADL